MKLAVIAIGVGLLAFGLVALLAPGFAANAYGIGTDSSEARAYVLATAIRDVALGSVVLALLGLGAQLRVLAASVFAIVLPQLETDR